MMASEARAVFRKSTPEEEEARLLDALSEVKGDLSGAYLRFNNAIEPELIEACVFEINALQRHYAYLLRRLKERGIRAEAFRFPERSVRP